MDEIKQYIKALTNLYGQVDPETVAEIYNSQNQVPIIIQDVALYLEEDMTGDYVYSYKDHFVHETIMVFNEFRKLRKQQRWKPYYVPDKKELLKYVDILYYEKPKPYIKLQKYLTQHYFKKKPKNAEILTERIRDKCLVGLDKRDLMADYEVIPKNDSEAEKIIRMAIELSNNTRRWEHNGHTPQELKDMGYAVIYPYSPSLLERIKHIFTGRF